MRVRWQLVDEHENVLATQGLGAWPKCGAQAGAPVGWGAPATNVGATAAVRCGRAACSASWTCGDYARHG